MYQALAAEVSQSAVRPRKILSSNENIKSPTKKSMYQALAAEVSQPAVRPRKNPFVKREYKIPHQEINVSSAGGRSEPARCPSEKIPSVKREHKIPHQEINVSSAGGRSEPARCPSEKNPLSNNLIYQSVPTVSLYSRDEFLSFSEEIQSTLFPEQKSIFSTSNTVYVLLLAIT
ncbi:hypothetical protein lbkm_2989 [Lachnospiraceae bacterium KM106-2]|nr:hypothetical protein lbkm_2989 [Lachnospiraceae bacterium KM106-2]